MCCFFTTFAVKFNYHKMDKELITSKLLFRLLAAVPVLLSGCAEFEDYSSSKNDSEYVEMVFTQDNKGTKAEIGEDGSGSFTEGDKVGLYIYISMESRQDRSY